MSCWSSARAARTAATGSLSQGGAAVGLRPVPRPRGDAAALLGRAERVITVQGVSQASSNPRLGFAVDGGQSFQVRELGPHDSRLDWKTLKGTAEVQDVARVQAAVLARIHARSAARAVGVANPLAEFREPAAFCQRKLAFALSYADSAARISTTSSANEPSWNAASNGRVHRIEKDEGRRMTESQRTIPPSSFRRTGSCRERWCCSNPTASTAAWSAALAALRAEGTAWRP